jgi:hypothetical protein
MSDFLDNIPAPPDAGSVPAGAPAATGTSPQPEIDGSIESDAFEGVATMGESLPMGTYHVRLDKYTEGWNNEDERVDNQDKNSPPLKFSDGEVVGKLPYFTLEWIVQQEPHTGRRYSEFAPWVTPTILQKAKAGDHVARQLLKDRLWKMKSIMAAANYNPHGPYNIKTDFFARHPEVKVQLGLKAGKSKINGQWVEDGSQQNKTIRYLPLNRPA